MVPDAVWKVEGTGLWSRVACGPIDALDARELVLQPLLVDAAHNALDLRLLNGQVADAVAR
jgi:hypothetical protein